MRTPSPGGTLIRLWEYTSPLLNWHIIDRWLRIGEKRKRWKKETSKNTFTKKVYLQIKRSEDFDRCINSINSLSSSTTDEDRFIQIIQQSSNTIKDYFVYIGVKVTIAMHVKLVVAFACIRQLSASRYIFPIIICFVVNLLPIAEIMCSILSIQKP